MPKTAPCIGCFVGDTARDSRQSDSPCTRASLSHGVLNDRHDGGKIGSQSGRQAVAHEGLMTLREPCNLLSMKHKY